MDVARTSMLPIQSSDIEVINHKIFLHEILRENLVDYDHYRAGVLPPGSQIPGPSESGYLCEDISPCDFPDFRSALLSNYTSVRDSASRIVPKFYSPKEKEQDAFCKYMRTVLPVEIKRIRLEQLVKQGNLNDNTEVMSLKYGNIFGRS